MKENNALKISVIIPVHPRHNNPHILGKCLASVSRQDYCKKNIEVIVIGDGCDVGKIVKSYLAGDTDNKTYIFSEHAGPIKARNKAIGLSSGELIAFLDADCTVREDWLSCMVNGFTSKEIGGCGGKTLDLNGLCINRLMIHGDSYILPCSCLGNVIFRRNVLQEIGFLDEQMTSGNSEEVDLSWRVYLKGCRIEYAPRAVAIHSGTQNLKNFFSHGMGMRLLMLKYNKILKIPAWVPIIWYLNIMRNNICKKPLNFSALKFIIVIFGYIYGFLMEKIGVFYKNKKIAFVDHLSFSNSSASPLGLDRNGQRLLKPNYVIWWKREDGCGIFNFHAHARYLMNDVSAVFWERLISGVPEEEIIVAVREGYDVPEKQAKEDLDSFLDSLLKEGLLIV